MSDQKKGSLSIYMELVQPSYTWTTAQCQPQQSTTKKTSTMNASPVQSTKYHTVSANVHKTVQTELKKFSFSLKQTTERRQLAIK